MLEENTELKMHSPHAEILAAVEGKMDREIIHTLRTSHEEQVVRPRMKAFKRAYNNLPCPCESKEEYKNCCYPFHQKKDFPETAEALMRSRYSAFALKLPEYLIETANIKSAEKEFKALDENLENIEYVGLQIVSTMQGKADDKIGKVEFIASYKHNDTLATHHEISKFKRFQKHWIYDSGEVL